MKAPGQLVLGQHGIVGPPEPLDALLAPPPAPLDDELLAALLDDELLATLLDDELLATLLDDELLATLLDDELLATLLEELPVPEPPAPVVTELLLEPVVAPLLELVAPALVVELDPAEVDPLVVAAPELVVADAALTPPLPALLSDVSSPERPFAQATAMTTGQAAQRSFKPRTPVV